MSFLDSLLQDKTMAYTYTLIVLALGFQERFFLKGYRRKLEALEADRRMHNDNTQRVVLEKQRDALRLIVKILSVTSLMLLILGAVLLYRTAAIHA